MWSVQVSEKVWSGGRKTALLELVSGEASIPQPYIGTPETGGLTLLTFFGDAGVVGRAAMFPLYFGSFQCFLCGKRGIRLISLVVERLGWEQFR